MTEKKVKNEATKSAKPPAKKATGEAAVLEEISASPEPGERLHAVILRSAPALQATVWYGVPEYAKDGQTVRFFRADKKYMMFGFTQQANLTREGCGAR
jgi:hypothetical protein